MGIDVLGKGVFREYNIGGLFNQGSTGIFAIKGHFNWNTGIAYIDVLNGANGDFCERYAIMGNLDTATSVNKNLKRCFAATENHCQVYYNNNRVVFTCNGVLLAKVVTNNLLTVSTAASDIDITGLTEKTFD